MTNELQLQALEGKDIKDLLTNVGSGGGAAAPAAGGAAAAGDAGAAAAEEKKEEGMYSPGCRCNATDVLTATAPEESDEDMGFGLFD